MFPFLPTEVNCVFVVSLVIACIFIENLFFIETTMNSYQSFAWQNSSGINWISHTSSIELHIFSFILQGTSGNRALSSATLANKHQQLFFSPLFFQQVLQNVSFSSLWSPSDDIFCIRFTDELLCTVHNCASSLVPCE